MVERVSSHKRLKGLSVVLTSAFLAASCSGSSPSPSETPTPTIRVLPTKTPIFTAPPEITPIPTPEPTPIVEKSVDEQVLKAAVGTWLNTINSRKQIKTEEGALSELHITHVLYVKAEDIKEWQNQIPEILNGGKSTTPLKVVWYGGGYFKDDNNPTKTNAAKSTGEVEINNVSLNWLKPAGLSDADKANGFTWQRQIRFDYIQRYHANFYSGTDLGDYNHLKNWVNSPEKNPYPEFSPWTETYIDLEVSEINGELKTKIINNERVGQFVGGNDMFKGFTIPGDFLKNLRCTNNSPCKATYVSMSSF